MSHPFGITVPERSPAGSPSAEAPVDKSRRRPPPPPRGSSGGYCWGDAVYENVIRSPSVQGFYPPMHHVDWKSSEDAAGSDKWQRILVSRHVFAHHGQNIVVDHLTARQNVEWIHYTVIYQQDEPAPFSAM